MYSNTRPSMAQNSTKNKCHELAGHSKAPTTADNFVKIYFSKISCRVHTVYRLISTRCRNWRHADVDLRYLYRSRWQLVKLYRGLRLFNYTYVRLSALSIRRRHVTQNVDGRLVAKVEYVQLRSTRRKRPFLKPKNSGRLA